MPRMMQASAALAPSPPGVEVCSCDESLALRAELAVARARLALFGRTDPTFVDARQRAIEEAWSGGDGGDGQD
jgi:hypothetical protein